MYLGHPVREIRLTGIAEREKEHLRQLLPQKVGEPLDRDRVHDSVNVLFNTGLFADIKVEAEKTEDDQVVLTYAMINNYFIGSVSVDGEPSRPSANQIISTTKFQRWRFRLLPDARRSDPRARLTWTMLRRS